MDKLNELKRVLQTLASPAPIQFGLFPDFVCVGDEMALEFDDALRLVAPLAQTFTTPQAQALEELDRYLDARSNVPDDFGDDDNVRSDLRWVHVRDLASSACAAFGWSVQTPEPSGAVYIPDTSADASS